MDTEEIGKLCALEDRHWWYAARRGVLRRQVAAFTGDRCGPGRALDVGAAGGGNTRVLTDLGWTATAVEQDAPAAAVARHRGLRVARADAVNLPVAPGSMDLVVAMDVMEHLDDDRAAMAAWAAILAPGGRLLITVPADPALWSAHDVAVGHRRRYVAVELRALATAAGVQVVDLWSWNVALRPAIAWRRRQSTGSDLDHVPGPLNLALRAVVEAERLVRPMRRWPGVTLVLVADRPAGGVSPATPTAPR
ncbi:MAG: class I SAM-dependent methyltransferase [Acidimicrobiales bacterium]